MLELVPVSHCLAVMCYVTQKQINKEVLQNCYKKKIQKFRLEKDLGLGRSKDLA